MKRKGLVGNGFSVSSTVLTRVRLQGVSKLCSSVSVVEVSVMCEVADAVVCEGDAGFVGAEDLCSSLIAGSLPWILWSCSSWR